MKPILFAGAALMVGASVYGLADYNKSGGRNVNEMYAKEMVKPVTTGKDALQEPVRAVKAVIATKELSKAGKKPAPAATVSSSKEPTRKLKAEKKIKAEFFSRAPLKEIDESGADIPEVTKKSAEVKKGQ